MGRLPTLFLSSSVGASLGWACAGPRHSESRFLSRAFRPPGRAGSWVRAGGSGACKVNARGLQGLMVGLGVHTVGTGAERTPWPLGSHSSGWGPSLMTLIPLVWALAQARVRFLRCCPQGSSSQGHQGGGHIVGTSAGELLPCSSSPGATLLGPSGSPPGQASPCT